MKEVTARISVPMFLVISGYMLFGNVQRYTHTVYFSKLKRRVRTLLIPYVIWNALSLLELMVKKLPVFAGLFPNIHKVIVDPTFCLEGFWALPGLGTPLYYPFWYIRDLMVLVVVSPVVYWALKKTRELWLLILFALVFCNVNVGYYLSSMLYFSIGAYWAIYRKDTLPDIHLLQGIALVWMLMAILDTATRNPQVHTVSILCGIGAMLFVGVTAVCKYRYNVNETLTKSVFFIYAIHATLLVYIYKGFERISPPHNEIWLFVFNTAMAVITLAVSFAVYRVFARYLPGACKIMCGGRK